jgi:dipeptidyl aminopeptidase/acylaminoacyl peptidase
MADTSGAAAFTDADDLETTVRLMASVGSCSSPTFSPDGTRLAFVSDMSGVPQVWTVAASGGWPELVTALDDQIRAVAWSPDGAWLACAAAPGGGMNQQVYLVRPDGAGLRRLTPGGTETNHLGDWTEDGRALVIASNRRNPAAMDPYLVDIASGTWQQVLESPGVGDLSVSRDMRLAVHTRRVNRGDMNCYLIDLATGMEQLLTPHEGPGTFTGAHFAPDGRTIYLIADDRRDLTCFARIALAADGAPGPIEPLAERPDAELQQFAINDAGDTAALLWNVSGRNELAFVDLRTNAQRPGPALPAEIANGLTFSKDGGTLAMTLSGAAAPPDIWVLQHATGTMTQVTHSPHPGVDFRAMVRPELVRFPAHDGLELSGWLYRPPGYAAPGPLALNFHGGPEGQERPIFKSLFQALLAQGIAILAPNVRGSSGFGKRFVNLDNGALRFNGIRDIESCLNYVVNAGIADPKRIGIFGGSYGGYMVMAGMTEYPERFAAGVNLYGVVNFATFFAQTEPWMAAISKVKYGDPETEADLLHRLSPIHKIDRVIAPILVLHGANDTNVPVVEAEQVVENLTRRGIPVEYILFPDEGHGFTKTANRIRSTVAIVRWFTRYLGVAQAE